MQQGIPLTLQQIPLLELPAKELLARFGSGGHKPGSGSAAALVGVLSCKLILTVISLTKDKEKYQQSVPELRKIENTIKNKTEVKLIKLFEEDSKVFDLVISARRERDRNEKGSVARKLATKEERLHTKKATEIPVEIANLCLNLAESAFFVYDYGFSSARGDSGVAISTAIAGANGALSVAYLNLIKARSSKWEKKSKKQCDDLLLKAQELQNALFSRVVGLRGESELEDQPPLFG